MDRGIDSQSHNGDPIAINTSNDLYGYYESANVLAKTVDKCATPFVVGVYGRWGRGKSTFLKTLKSELSISANGQSFLHLDYSPWQYHLQSFNDVWISIISELASEEGSIAKGLKELVKSITVRKSARAIFGTAATLLGVGDAAGKALKDLLGDDEAAANNEYSDFIDAKKKFSVAIENYLKEDSKRRVFIYVDDIDRCEPVTSVNVLRAIQLLGRTPGCVFILGLDRDVIVHNLEKVYENRLYAKEYLDKIVQLHVELPILETEDLKNALLFDAKGNARTGVEPFVEWVARFMDYNPRKVERFCYLYDYKLSLPTKQQKDPQFYRKTVLHTVWELRWPELATEIARSRDILDATEKLRSAKTIKGEKKVLNDYAHLPILKQIQADREFLLVFRKIYEI